MTVKNNLGKPSLPRILLTGSTGQVGGDLLPILRRFADVIAPSRAELDLTQEEALRAYVQDLEPDWIINPAAYTAVDRAETEPADAQALNLHAPRILAEEAARCGAALIHFSTDYVFDGTGTKPWTEADQPDPLSVYGQTKLEGEKALTQSDCSHVILRTSWIFGTRGRNFLRTILKLAGTHDEIRIVADQFGAPTWSYHLAEAVESLVSQVEEEARQNGKTVSQVLAEKRGTYHVASAGETTWYGFAQEFLRIASTQSVGTRWAKLVPIRTEDYPTAAHRPRNSRLDCDRFRKQFGLVLPDWKIATHRVMDSLMKAGLESS